jgi:hypothetical protein
VVAATKLPTVADVPLYFKAVSVTLQPDEKSGVSAANGILYQMSGSTEVALDGEAKLLNAGEGLFIAGGKTAALTAGSGGPSTFLHFFLAPAADLGRPAETAPATARELYRTANPIPDLKPGGYDLNLTRVTFPAQIPSSPPRKENSRKTLWLGVQGLVDLRNNIAHGDYSAQATQADIRRYMRGIKEFCDRVDRHISGAVAKQYAIPRPW